MTNRAATFVKEINLIFYCWEYCCKYNVCRYCGNVIVVCEFYGSVVNVYGVLKNCGSVIVICEYNGDVVDVYGYE